MMIPIHGEVYVVYMILGDGHEYAVELATEEVVCDTPYWSPSENYWMLPIRQS